MQWRKVMSLSNLTSIRAVAIAAVLLVAACLKFVAFSVTAQGWSTSPGTSWLANSAGSETLVAGAIVAELGLALALVFPATRRVAFGLAFVGCQLGLVWLLIIALNAGAVSKCGCLGAKVLSTEQHVVLLVGLSLLSLGGRAGIAPQRAA